MDLLDSLGTKPRKFKPKKSSVKNKEKQHEETDADKAPTTQSQPEVEQQSTAGANVSVSDDTTEKLNNSDNLSESSDFVDPVAKLSNWWSRNKTGLWSMAAETVNDAVKQAKHAEALVREEQQNLQSFNFSSIQSKLTSVLNTIAPPIAEHEQLQIHVFHDMVGWPVVDEIIFDVFDYVMDQIDGTNKLNLVVQKGKERHLAGSDDVDFKRLNFVECSLEDGVKLAKANIEEVVKAAKSTEVDSTESSKTTETTATTATTETTESTESTESKEEPESSASGKPSDTQSARSELYVSLQPVLTKGSDQLLVSHQNGLYFVVYLVDFQNNIEISSASQPFPSEWTPWLDGELSGSIDPRKWINGWVEDGISLVIGTVVQKYVTQRMQVQ